MQGIEFNYVAATEQSLMRRRRLGEKKTKTMWKFSLELGKKKWTERKIFFVCGRGKVWSEGQRRVKIIFLWTMAVRDTDGIRMGVTMKIDEGI